MQPLLEVEGLKKTYPGFQLNGVSFSIYEDCITGFIGANGAGKTTTIRSILHLISHEAGTIKFKGKDISKTEELDCFFLLPLGQRGIYALLRCFFS